MTLRRFAVACTGILLGPVDGTVLAQQKPYSEGPVTVVTYVRTKPGRFEDYMRYLQTETRGPARLAGVDTAP